MNRHFESPEIKRLRYELHERTDALRKAQKLVDQTEGKLKTRLNETTLATKKAVFENRKELATVPPSEWLDRLSQIQNEETRIAECERNK